MDLIKDLLNSAIKVLSTWYLASKTKKMLLAFPCQQICVLVKIQLIVSYSAQILVCFSSGRQLGLCITCLTLHIYHSCTLSLVVY